MRETVVLYCTDRGQHPRAFVCEAVKVDVGWLVAHSLDSPRPRRKGGVRAGRHGDYKGPVTRTLVCPRCTRRPQISESRWGMLLDSAIRAAPPELDVSYLD